MRRVLGRRLVSSKFVASVIPFVLITDSKTQTNLLKLTANLQCYTNYDLYNDDDWYSYSYSYSYSYETGPQYYHGCVSMVVGGDQFFVLMVVGFCLAGLGVLTCIAFAVCCCRGWPCMGTESEADKDNNTGPINTSGRFIATSNDEGL